MTDQFSKIGHSNFRSTRTTVPHVSAEHVFESPLYQDIKFRTLALVQEALEARAFVARSTAEPALRREISQALSTVMAGTELALNALERQLLVDEVAFEVAGL